MLPTVLSETLCPAACCPPASGHPPAPGEFWALKSLNLPQTTPQLHLEKTGPNALRPTTINGL